MKNEETSSTATTMGAHSPSDGRAPAPEFKPCGKIAGTSYFECDRDTFNAAREGRKSGQRWNTFLKANNQFSNDLRAWSRKNGNPDIMLKNGNSFMWAQKGLSRK